MSEIDKPEIVERGAPPPLGPGDSAKKKPVVDRPAPPPPGPGDAPGGSHTPDQE